MGHSCCTRSAGFESRSAANGPLSGTPGQKGPLSRPRTARRPHRAAHHHLRRTTAGYATAGSDLLRCRSHQQRCGSRQVKVDRMKRVFTAFAIEDTVYRDFLVGQARLDSSPFEFVDMSVKEPWDTSWKTKCRSRILGC